MARRFYGEVFVDELDVRSHASLVFHVFSNNGARFLDRLLSHIAVENPALLTRVRGVAFDSCPARVGADS